MCCEALDENANFDAFLSLVNILSKAITVGDKISKSKINEFEKVDKVVSRTPFHNELKKFDLQF